MRIKRTIGREQSDARFHRLYGAHGRAILAYAIRRSPEPQDAADVLAETFLIAWRRLDDIPEGETAKLWLYGVARRVLANQQRGERRRDRLAERLYRELPAAVAAASAADARRDDGVLEALSALDRDDREILLLAGWEELDPVEIATVLGISRVAARSRLHRARARLRARLAADCAAPEPATSSIVSPRFKEAS